MVRSKIQLAINKTEYFKIKIPSTLEVFRFHDVLITFHDKCGIEYILYDDLFETGLELLRFYLRKAVDKQLLLDPSIIPGRSKQDIGYLWDVYRSRIFSEESDEYPERSKQDIEGFVNKGLPLSERLIFEDKNGELDWIGMRYYMWSSRKELPDTWLYNKDGKIYLELTPSYKWHTRDPKKNEKFISHNDFQLNYQPLVIAEITEEAARDLLIKIEEVLNFIEENDRKYLNGRP